MNKILINKRTTKILLEIHRGFLTKEASEKLIDQEILEMIPKDSLSPKALKDSDDSIMVRTPFTRKWVRKQVKKDVDITSVEILKSVGFIDG